MLDTSLQFKISQSLAGRSTGYSKSGMSNLFLQRASFKFKNVERAAFKKHDNDELKLYLY
jgi:hypothetical protein